MKSAVNIKCPAQSPSLGLCMVSTDLLANLQIRVDNFAGSKVNPHFCVRGSKRLKTMIVLFCINYHLECLFPWTASDLPRIKRSYFRKQWNRPHLNSLGWHQIKPSEYFLKTSELMSNTFQGHGVALNCLNKSKFALSVT